MFNRLQTQGGGFFCPNGHGLLFNAGKPQAQRDNIVARMQSQVDQLEAALKEANEKLKGLTKGESEE